jgi:hypothetical protein
MCLSYVTDVSNGQFILHTEKLHDLYRSRNFVRTVKSRRLQWAENVARVWEKNTYRILENSPVGKRPLGRSRTNSMEQSPS